ncbi:hypothetical protein ADL04_15370 [Streptomyces sp. NRRL B-3648]|nr:hypothetical protein ADL04_15370 [Streptomyces sp. NRRL B-3648]
MSPVRPGAQAAAGQAEEAQAAAGTAVGPVAAPHARGTGVPGPAAQFPPGGEPSGIGGGGPAMISFSPARRSAYRVTASLRRSYLAIVLC